MRMWMKPFAFAAVLALGAAACEDGATNTNAFDDAGLRMDAAMVAADGMFQDLAHMESSTVWAGTGFAPEAVGVEIQGTRSFSKTVTFFDAGGQEQNRYDAETTASMHIVADLTREVTHTFWSADIDASQGHDRDGSARGRRRSAPGTGPRPEPSKRAGTRRVAQSGPMT